MKAERHWRMQNVANTGQYAKDEARGLRSVLDFFAQILLSTILPWMNLPVCTKQLKPKALHEITTATESN